MKTTRVSKNRAQPRSQASTSAPKLVRTSDASRGAPRGLELLLGPMRDEFLRTCWPERPFVYHGSLDRLVRLTSAAALQGVPQLLSARAAHYQDMTVFGGNGFAKRMAPREAIHFYQRGDNLSCSDLESTIPEVRAVLAELAADLREPPQYFHCGVFAASGGRGVTMHYDTGLNFNVQLRGEKVWRLAPNRHVDHPLEPCDNQDDHAPRFARRPFPSAMPGDAMTFRVKPGSVVFVPRGYWHETDTFGESLALTMVLDPPTWRRRVLHELGRRLELLAQWRAYPMAMAGSPADREGLVQQLDALLPQLREAVGTLRSEEVLDAPLSQRGFRWAGGQRAALSTTGRRGGARHVLRLPGEAATKEAAVDAALEPVVRWLCAQTSPWSAEQARAACASVSTGYVDALLGELVAQGFLETV
jgi:50S ribosomal protein L16 3-hydroxylase